MSDALQTRFASHLDLHQSPYHAAVMHQIGWKVVGDPGTQLFFRTLGPLTIAKYQRPTNIDPELLHTFRRRTHTLTTYVEPGLNTSYLPGITVEPFAHSTTSLLDLSLSLPTLLSSFRQKTRYNITHSLKSDKLTLTSTPLPRLTSEQRQIFFSLHSEWSHRKNVIGYSRELLLAILSCFDARSYLHIAYTKDQTPLGALLVLTHSQVSTYYAAFSTELGYSLYAPTLLTYQALLTAKEHHSDIFDFGGTYDARYPRMYKKWQGFTKFKAGFNPTTIQYPPTKLHLFW